MADREIKRGVRLEGGLYLPGQEDALEKAADADTLAYLSDSGAIVGSWEGVKSAAPAGDKDPEDMTKDELEAKANELNLTVVRSDGEEGEPLKVDYLNAVKAALAEGE